MACQRQDVARPLAQRRDGQGEDAETVIEILAEPACLDLRTQVSVGGGDHAHVETQHALAAQPLDLALLQDPQQLALQAQFHLGDLVEQQGAALGEFELAGPGLVGAGKGAPFVAEQHRLQHVFRDGRAIDGHEGLGRPGRVGVQVAGKDLLADPRFAVEHHRDLRGGNPGYQLQQLQAARVLQHQAVGRTLAALGELPDAFGNGVDAKGLDQEVRGALAHGRDRRLDTAVGAGEHHRELRLAAPGLAQEFDPAHRLRLATGEDDPHGLASQAVQRRLTVLGLEHPAMVPGQVLAHPGAQTRILVHQQDRRGVHHHARPLSSVGPGGDGTLSPKPVHGRVSRNDARLFFL